MGPNAAKELARMVADNRVCYVSSLSLKKNVLGDAGVAALAEGVAKSHSLVHLDLASNGVSREGAVELFEALGQNSSLTCLRVGSIKGINRNFLGPAAMTALGEALKQHMQLTCLDLQGAAICSKGLRCLVDGLKATKSLKEMNIADNGLTSTAVPAVVEIMHNTCIERLDISHNDLGSSLKTELSKSTAVQGFDLTHLSMCGCGFSGPGSNLLFRALRRDRFLIELKVDEIGIDPAELDCLKEFIVGNKSLRRFFVRGSSLGDAGVQRLADGLGENQVLEELDLSGNKIEARENVITA